MRHFVLNFLEDLGAMAGTSGSILPRCIYRLHALLPGHYGCLKFIVGDTSGLPRSEQDKIPWVLPVFFAFSLCFFIDKKIKDDSL